ncbi:MAG TPA: UDP-3-O-(3-hydroxymyristoyl)glucosamine N-acyltransferase [Ramlibacter sp.]|nr:UDP-3-O-(3-hydroxymyristoyl)glucosamine N-acyltransferase [Ramlibacter sp.]
MPHRLGTIVRALGGELHGDENRAIGEIAPLETAGPSAIAFLSNPRYLPQLAASKAGCVIVGAAAREAAIARGDCIVTDDPYFHFARLTQWWKQQEARDEGPAIHPSAVVHPDAVVDPTAQIGPLCVVERGARIGANTVLKSRVNVGERCSLGARCIVHPGVVIGADGFGFAPHGGQFVKIEQLGAVQIGDDVEIGANTCIDRGALSDTVIEEGVKLDNLIQVGHNVHIGKHTVVAGCVGISGSAKIGAHCMIGGGVGIAGHLTIADHVTVAGFSLVSGSIHKAGHYAGAFPIDDNASWLKNAAALRQLHQLRERIKALEKKT